MSWFTDIAGKAEDLLNRVDQTAATALQNASKSPHRKKHSHDVESSDKNYSQQDYSIKEYSNPTKNLKLSPFSSKPPEQKSVSMTNISTLRKKSESDDEKLLRFLNSDPLPTPSRKFNDTKVFIKNEKETVKDKSIEVKKSNEGSVDENQDNSSKSVSDQVDSITNVDSNAPSELKVENKEMSNGKISDVVTFNKENSEVKASPIKTSIQTDFNGSQANDDHSVAEKKRISKKLDHFNSQISGNDKYIRELREREKDMVAAIDAKDSQIAILKVRLQESDQELASKCGKIDELKFENERIIKEHAEVATMQNKTVESLQQQLQQLESELSKTKDSSIQNQNKQMYQISKMEEEHRHLVESYSSLQKKWSELNERNKDMSMQLKFSSSNFDALQQEYNDYKQKAQRILQSKEKLISSLKEGNIDLESVEKNEASSLILNAEVEAVKQERDILKDEIRRANELIETYRSEMQEFEKNSEKDLFASQESCNNLKESFEAEKAQKEEYQLLSVQLKEELQFLREDLAQTKNTFQSRIQDREIEIEKLRRQLTAKSLSTVSQEELESRLHALTENLIQKQTIVEALSTEKNSLVLQLERLEQQLREAQSYNSQQHTFVGISNTETERKSKVVYLDNPFDSTLTRKVKRVYGSIDSFSIRLGVFFRRYPISRVFVIVYMLLLHFWVLFVLLTYEPEIHDSKYENSPMH